MVLLGCCLQPHGKSLFLGHSLYFWRVAYLAFHSGCSLGPVSRQDSDFQLFVARLAAAEILLSLPSRCPWSLPRTCAVQSHRGSEGTWCIDLRLPLQHLPSQGIPSAFPATLGAPNPILQPAALVFCLTGWWGFSQCGLPPPCLGSELLALTFNLSI